MSVETPIIVRSLVALGGIALVASAWSVRGDAPLVSVTVLLAGAALVAAVVLLERDRRRKFERIRNFVALGDRDPQGRGLEERGDAAWARTAAALNVWAASLRQRLDDEAAVRDRLETVIGALEEAFLLVNRDGRVLFANARLGALFSVPENPVGRTALEVVRERAVLDELDAALAGQERAGELRLGPAGQIHVRYRVSPYPGQPATPAGGGAGGAVAFFHDISELRRAETARSDFLANASHEIKTPLSAVRGYAEILADRDPGDPTSKRAVEAILNNAKRLTALVEDLLELARIEGGALRFETRAFEAGDVARSLLRDLEERSRSADVEMSFEARGDTSLVGDRRAFEQVIGNLVDNALKYTPAGGAVRLRIGPGEAPETLRIEVHDNGNGIALRHQDRVFERFYRVDPGRSRKLGGTGLGLAIVKHLVQEGMGGDVGLTSTPGRGSCFWVELPRRENGTALAVTQTAR